MVVATGLIHVPRLTNRPTERRGLMFELINSVKMGNNNKNILKPSVAVRVTLPPNDQVACNPEAQQQKTCNLYAQRLFIFYIICMSKEASPESKSGKGDANERTKNKKITQLLVQSINSGRFSSHSIAVGATSARSGVHAKVGSSFWLFFPVLFVCILVCFDT